MDQLLALLEQECRSVVQRRMKITSNQS